MRVLRVDTRKSMIVEEELRESWKYFGNRGLIAKILTDEVDPQSDPMGSENKFIVTTGLFAGTPIPTANRLSVGCKSPLTGGIKEANSGGNFAAALASHGIKAIIIEELPDTDELKILKIDPSGQAALLPAGDCAGMGNYALVEKMHETYGDKTAVASIGPAGERGKKAATIQVTDNATGHPARAAARGGVGAVLGSKGIKAIVVEKADKKIKPVPVDKAVFNSGKKALIDMIKSHPYSGAGLALLGTPAFVDVTSEGGILPVRNFKGEKLTPDELSGVETRSFISKIEANKGKVGVACQAGCTVRCSNIYNDSDGNMITSGLEYETLALIGPNCDIYDMDFLAESDRFCDDVGLDTIEVGAALGVAMDAGALPWGDIEAVRGVYRQISEDTGLGAVLAHGAQAIGESLEAKRIPTVRNQALAAYDPRGSQGMGISFATSPQGADHTTLNTLGIAEYDHKATKGIAQTLKTNRTAVTVGDNCMCLFAMIAVADDKDGMKAMAETMTGLYGKAFTAEDIVKIGSDTLDMEFAFNEKAGFKSEDHKLPDFFYDEVSPSTGQAFNVGHDEMMASIL